MQKSLLKDSSREKMQKNAEVTKYTLMLKTTLPFLQKSVYQPLLLIGVDERRQHRAKICWPILHNQNDQTLLYPACNFRKTFFVARLTD